MLRKPSHFVTFFIFLAAFGVLLFLNYKSFTSTQSLIDNNDKLVQELELSSNIQFFQTHLVLLDNYMNQALSSLDKRAMEEVERELKILSLSSSYLHTMFYHHRQGEVYQDFEHLLARKLKMGQRMIDEYKAQFKFSKELVSELKQNSDLNDSINEQLYQLEEVNENKAIEKSKETKIAERNTQRLNLIFMAISSLLFAVALIYIFLRIRDQQNLIAELEQAKTKEVKLNKIKDDFIANMSHEIRTPLNVILGFSALMEKENLSDKLKDMVQTLKNAGGQLMMIVNQVLDVAKIEEGKLELDSKPFHLRTTFDVIDSSYRKLIEDKGLEFIVEPNIKEDITVLGDQNKLLQILSNLLSNAQKFTAKGKISLRANLAEEETQTILHISISDTGIGIEQNKLHSIFDRFEQADNNITRNYGGTGLGLAIVKQLVDLMKGMIKVESTLGQGSIFFVSLPVILEKVSVLQTPRNSIDGEILEGTKILVVEDNALNTKLLQNWLPPDQMLVTYTTTAIEALDVLKRERFDIILLDIQMPGMDGYTCAQHIRNEIRLATPIIGMTAHTRRQDMLDCYAAGMHGHIAKPIDKAELFYLLTMYSSMKHASLINDEYLKELSGGNEAFIRDLMDEFLKQTPIENEKLRRAFFDENVALIQTTAHTLKTNYGYLGLDEKYIHLFRALENYKEMPKNYNSFFLADYLFESVKEEMRSDIA